MSKHKSKRWLRPLLIGLTSAFIIAEILVFSPTRLEQPTSPSPIEPESLLPNHAKNLAEGIPEGIIPEYSVDEFNYVSTDKGIKQWKLVAEHTDMYGKEKIVHARIVTAYLFDAQDQATVVTGKEAKYLMNGRDLEIYGDVVTLFPDGFETQSQYLRYFPDKRMIEIPLRYAVTGQGSEKDEQRLAFTSQGLFFDMNRSEITLPSQAVVTMTRQNQKGQTFPETTRIESDRALILRTAQTAHFTMSAKRAVDQRFVQITQPNLFVKSREADLHYGDFAQILQYMVAKKDVLIRETGESAGSFRYATGGRADFDSRKNLIVLKEYPQVYQDNDTVTGDVIILHRDTDVVEVENANSFSEGTP